MKQYYSFATSVLPSGGSRRVNDQRASAVSGGGIGAAKCTERLERHQGLGGPRHTQHSSKGRTPCLVSRSYGPWLTIMIPLR